MSNLYRLNVGESINTRWVVTSVLGEGGYGAVYEVKDVQDRTEALRYACKVESNTAPDTERVLRMEEHILNRLRTMVTDEARTRFCSMEDTGKMAQYSYLVMTLVGMSLNEVRHRCGGKFNMRTAGHIAINSLKGIQTLHKIDFLHRDIKPGNFAIGRPPSYDRLYLLDFGLCRLYRHPDGRLRRPRDRTGFRGTLRYASIACHRGEEMGRKDDLFSWLYMVIESIVGTLPWHSLMAEMKDLPLKEKVERVGNAKVKLNKKPTVLMQGCPLEFKNIHTHLMCLNFQGEPNYDLVIRLLQQVVSRRSLPSKDGEKLDWEPGGRCYQVFR